MSERFDRLLTHGRAATMTADGAPYGAIEDAVVLIRQSKIAWIGPRADLPASAEAEVVEDLDGRWITPGLIDCHTHLVFGGDRSGEFERRLQGESYEQIARAGGGILSTVKATRAASEPELLASALARLEGLKRDGVTTVEIKSGYGLDLETELKQLRVARAVGREGRVRVIATYLGLHALPAAFRDCRRDFIDLVVGEILPAAVSQGLVDAVDAYCEPIAFTPEEVGRLFEAARARGLPVKLHADQLSNSDGAGLAARFGALSADHLEHTDDAGAAALAAAGTVAVLLPGAYLTLRETKAPPIEALRKAKVPMAVASDCNPGTSPMPSMLTAIHLACAQFRLTPEEALAGATRCAARALGLELETGTLEAGKAADIAVWDVERPAELAYWLGKPMLHKAYVGGEPRA